MPRSRLTRVEDSPCFLTRNRPEVVAPPLNGDVRLECQSTSWTGRVRTDTLWTGAA